MSSGVTSKVGSMATFRPKFVPREDMSLSYASAFADIGAGSGVRRTTSMPHVIIGHTTSDSVRVWVRGDASSRTCDVTLRPPPHKSSSAKPVDLPAEHDYTATVEFGGLEPDLAYAVHAMFAPSNIRVTGRARTLKQAPDDTISFSFVLSSCNLSIVSINDFLALLAATAGAALGNSSLDVPAHRWTAPLRWLRGLIRFLAKGALWVAAKLIQAGTGFKQSGSRYIRSPFLKISAVFESYVLDIPSPPTDSEKPEDVELRKRLFLAVGDRVESSWGASGVVASMADVASQGVRRVVVTQVEGEFERDAVLFRRVDDDDREPLRRLGPIIDARRGRQWYHRPSFFIHAGDQIYYDFPEPRREPRVEDYRLAYREAWFEDDALRHVLAHWPHYMTLDDHEIADQFAGDFNPPAKKASAEQYRDEAVSAYREYAHALNPHNESRLWMTFDHGRTRFFMMDTRTHRHNASGKIIDDAQMAALLDWMSRHRTDLKFVVTSVPFVAEIDERVTEAKDDWFKDRTTPAQPKPNSEQDKWSAARFKAQRHEIIEHVAAHRIERVVFLTGDMHCCYHATMRIGSGPTNYESITVHELAGGPVNQLQLADVNQFVWQRTSRTVGPRPVQYVVCLERFHGDVSAVMHLTVDYVTREQFIKANTAVDEDVIGTPAPERVPEVEWNVIRTLTDPGPDGWLDQVTLTSETSSQQRRGRVTPAGRSPADTTKATEAPRSAEPVMGGRISFAARRQPEELLKW